jgi:hypothetical protein
MTAAGESGEPSAASNDDLQQRWTEMCQEVEAVHREMSEFVDPPFRGLFLLEADKFTRLGAPGSEAELAVRRNQRAALSGKIAALAQAGAIAKMNEHVSATIVTIAEDLCLQQLPSGPADVPEFQRRLVQFADRLSVVCRDSSRHAAHDKTPSREA